jgi:hypothetical protein
MEELHLSAVELHGVNHIRQTEMRTTEPLVHAACSSKVEIAIQKLKRYTLLGIDKFRQNSSKQEVIHCILRFTNY